MVNSRKNSNFYSYTSTLLLDRVSQNLTLSRFGLPDEKEILFSPGTIFRVHSVLDPDINDSSLWIIKLTLKKEMVEHVERVINF